MIILWTTAPKFVLRVEYLGSHFLMYQKSQNFARDNSAIMYKKLLCCLHFFLFPNLPSKFMFLITIKSIIFPSSLKSRLNNYDYLWEGIIVLSLDFMRTLDKIWSRNIKIVINILSNCDFYIYSKQQDKSILRAYPRLILIL